MPVEAAEKKAAVGGMTRNIGLMAAINIIISVMIGSGIFISPTGALKHSGSVGLCLVIWIACGIISFMGKHNPIYIQLSNNKQKLKLPLYHSQVHYVLLNWAR